MSVEVEIKPVKYMKSYSLFQIDTFAKMTGCFFFIYAMNVQKCYQINMHVNREKKGSDLEQDKITSIKDIKYNPLRKLRALKTNTNKQKIQNPISEDSLKSFSAGAIVKFYIYKMMR